MNARIHYLPLPAGQAHYPEHLAPLLNWHGVAGAIGGTRASDARADIDRLLADQRSAWDWAIANRVGILSINADRNGAYLFVSPSPTLHTLFGEECACIRRCNDHGLETTLWLGCIGHIRVFWREVKCAP